MSTWMFFGAPLFGHTNPTLPVVSELVRRGERVIYYNSERFHDAIRATGAEFRVYRGFPELPPVMSTRMLDLVPLLAAASETFLDAEAKELLAERPDYVINDCVAIWGAEASRLLRVPRISTIPGFVVNDSVAKLAAKIMPRRALPGDGDLRLRDIPKLLSIFRKRKRISRKHGLEFKRIVDIWHAELNLVFTSSDLQPYAEEFTDGFRFVGSPTVEREERETFPFHEVTRPIVYISLGTLFGDRPAFFESCYEALADMDVQVILSLGSRNASLPSLEAPQNFIIRDFVPQIETLRRAACFVNHGGVGSASEALHFGVPQVFSPQIWDGYMMAHQVSQAGAGIVLSENPPAAEVRAAIERVLGDPSFGEKSRELGRGLAAPGGASRAAEEILEWASSKRLNATVDGKETMIAG